MSNQKKSVLLLGDSHTYGTYGSALEAIFKRAGWDVTRVGWVGASAGNYLKGNYRTLGMGGAGDFEAAKAGRYDLAVVTLGTNDAAGAGSRGASDAAAKIKQVADQINASKLVWVGPPAFSDNAARTYNKSFAKEDLNTRAAALWAAGSKLFKNAIDPRAATAGVTLQKDIHFDAAGGARWAQFVFDRASKMGGGFPWLALAAVLPVGALAAWLLLRKKPATPAPMGQIPPALLMQMMNAGKQYADDPRAKAAIKRLNESDTADEALRDNPIYRSNPFLQTILKDTKITPDMRKFVSDYFSQGKGAFGAMTSNADLDKFRFVFRKKQDGHSLSVYDGKKLIGKVGALTKSACYTDDSPLAKYRKHADVVQAEILPEYRGRKLYQEMLLRLNKYAKEELGCKGIKSDGFQRSIMANRAWRKVNPRVVPDPTWSDQPLRDTLYLDGLPTKGRIPVATAKRAMKKLPAKTKKCGFTPGELREGMEIEREHRDVTKGRVGTTAKIAASHLCEDRRYYKKLKKYVEKKGKS